MRVLLLIMLIGLIYWVVSRLIATYKSDQHQETQSGQNPSSPQQSALKIVQCSRCGCHVPENESHINNQQVVCNSTQCNES